MKQRYVWVVEKFVKGNWLFCCAYSQHVEAQNIVECYESMERESYRVVKYVPEEKK